MRFLVILAIVLLATKKAAEFALALFCALLFGYGSWVLVRDFRTPGFLLGAKRRAA